MLTSVHLAAGTQVNHTAWTQARWVAGWRSQSARCAGRTVTPGVQRNRLVDDDGERQIWAKIRSGLSNGMLPTARPTHAIDLARQGSGCDGRAVHISDIEASLSSENLTRGRGHIVVTSLKN
jgi:hypothetical protein